MVMDYQLPKRHLSRSGVVRLIVVAFFSIQVVVPAVIVFAQADTPADSHFLQAPPSPSHRPGSGLQYFGLSGAKPGAPYVGDEGIPIMAETVVEGEAVDSLNRPFDEYPHPFDEYPQEALEDPWEDFNAEVFDFNYGLYRHLMKPVAKGYNVVVPPDVQVSIENAFHNMGFVSRFLNSLFQGKYERAGTETKRFLINTTMGLGGFFDVAKYVFDTEAPPSEDTGQTLAVHGIGSGPFLMLPLLPPLTIRDAVGFAGDIFLNPVNYLIPILPNLGMNAENAINTRALNIETFEGIEESTVDLYGAVRSGYFQRRSKDIAE